MLNSKSALVVLTFLPPLLQNPAAAEQAHLGHEGGLQWGNGKQSVEEPKGRPREPGDGYLKATN